MSRITEIKEKLHKIRLIAKVATAIYEKLYENVEEKEDRDLDEIKEFLDQELSIDELWALVHDEFFSESIDDLVHKCYAYICKGYDIQNQFLKWPELKITWHGNDIGQPCLAVSVFGMVCVIFLRRRSMLGLESSVFEKEKIL